MKCGFVVLFLLYLLNSFAQDGELFKCTFTNNSGEASLSYERQYSKETLEGGQINYTTVYCLYDLKGGFLFEFHLTHHFTTKELTFFFSKNSPEGLKSSCNSQKHLTVMEMLLYALNGYFYSSEGVYWYEGIRLKYVSEKKEHFDLLEYDNPSGINFDFTK